MQTKNFIWAAILLLAFSRPTIAQVSRADYKRADSIVSVMSKSVLLKPEMVNAIEGSSDFWYRTRTADGIRYFYVQSAKNRNILAFDHQKLADEMAKQASKKINAASLPIAEVDFSSKGDTLMFSWDGYKWSYVIKKNNLVRKQKIPEPRKSGHWAGTRNELGREPVTSPDGKWIAFIREYNLWIKNAATNKEIQLSFDGSPGEFYSSYLKWSPNSRFIAVHKFRPAEKRFMKFMESSPKNQIQPILHEIEYAKPGDALPIRVPVLFSVSSRKQINVTFSEFMQQYNLTDPEWRADSRAFTVEFNQRGHQRYTVLEIDTTKGDVNVIANEKYNTFFHYSGKKFRRDIDDGKEMIWMSERDGWNHLYLLDANGMVKNRITKGEWVVRKVERIDEKSRTILFSAGGVHSDEDPYHLHYFRVGFDGNGLVELTPESAEHQVTFSDDYKYMVDYLSRADMPGKTVLRNVADGQIISTLQETNVEELEKTGWKMPEIFSSKGRDGATDIWGLIYRPTNFDPNKKYPVIEYIYAGPHSSFVPKGFIAYNSRFAGLAELGFILVQIDGMGTSNRSKAFHDVCWQNLKDAGFPDRIAWMKAAAAKYPFMDIERVGIFGGSAGGQNSTGALLFHPEFYDVAVSSCGCHDNRMDKIWWNEQWMGYPIGPHYDACSNVTNAHKLKGNLMLILGEVDDNVDPSSTYQVADALIKANKEFELIVVPGMNHSSGGDFGERKRRDFFVRHLLNVNTPEWNK